MERMLNSGHANCQHLGDFKTQILKVPEGKQGAFCHLWYPLITMTRLLLPVFSWLSSLQECMDSIHFNPLHAAGKLVHCFLPRFYLISYFIYFIRFAICKSKAKRKKAPFFPQSTIQQHGDVQLDQSLILASQRTRYRGGNHKAHLKTLASTSS